MIVVGFGLLFLMIAGLAGGVYYGVRFALGVLDALEGHDAD